MLSRKLQLSQKRQRYPNSADLGEGLGSVSASACLPARKSLAYMNDQLVYVNIYTHTHCDTHVYRSIIQHSICLPFEIFFFPSYLSVCEGERKANMPSFREL